jgi:hypothetical protein
MWLSGDTIYVGRYLVSGADSASLFLEVDEVVGGWCFEAHWLCPLARGIAEG